MTSFAVLPWGQTEPKKIKKVSGQSNVSCPSRPPDLLPVLECLVCSPVGGRLDVSPSMAGRQVDGISQRPGPGEQACRWRRAPGALLINECVQSEQKSQQRPDQTIKKSTTVQCGCRHALAAGSLWWSAFGYGCGPLVLAPRAKNRGLPSVSTPRHPRWQRRRSMSRAAVAVITYNYLWCALSRTLRSLVERLSLSLFHAGD